MGLIFTNICPYLTPVSLGALNPKALDPAALHGWVRLHMRILQSKKDTSHQFASQCMLLSKGFQAKNPSAVIMCKAKKLRTLTGKTLNESLECCKRRICKALSSPWISFWLLATGSKENKFSYRNFPLHIGRRYIKIWL